MKLNQYVWKNQKKLRMGYTTGSCAAAAAKAAAIMLLSGETVDHLELLTPKGIKLYLDVERMEWGTDYVTCAIKKDAGDDPDVTDGIAVYARVEKTAGDGIRLDGGEGIGRVTRKGLEQEVGQAAINKVPREMILREVREQKEHFGYPGGLAIIISIPEGTALAVKTFNPRLGIVGGISVLGTSGIVEPMSEQALVETIYIEMKMLKEKGSDWCYVVPGNYGQDFLTECLGYDGGKAVRCSNYIGEMIDKGIQLNMQGILLVGHIGKLVKIAAGVMNTHSKQADCRLEVMAVHAAMAGAKTEIVQALMNCITTTEAVDLLQREGILAEVMKRIMEKIAFHLKQRAGNDLVIGAVMFSKEHGILGKTENADDILRKI